MRKLLTFLKTLTAALAVIVLFTACKQLLDDPEDFLSYWASEAFVKDHSIGSAARPDGAGVPCVGSSDNVLITLTAHNPKGFSLVMPTSSEPAGIVEFKELSSQPAAGADYELRQTGSGTLELTYKQDFLKRYEQGSGSLNPTITLKATDGRVFKQTYTFGIKSNTPPPAPKDIVIAKTNTSPSKYVLCLKFDSDEMRRKIGNTDKPVHNDIANITIKKDSSNNGSSYKLLYKGDDSDFQQLDGGSFITHGSVAKLTEDIPSAQEKWVLYYKTDIEIETGNDLTRYYITLRDREGVVSDEAVATIAASGPTHTVTFSVAGGKGTLKGEYGSQNQIAQNGGGTATLTNVPNGAQVNFTATPTDSNQYKVGDWTCTSSTGFAGTSENPIATLTVTANTTVTVQFVQLPALTLTKLEIHGKDAQNGSVTLPYDVTQVTQGNITLEFSGHPGIPFTVTPALPLNLMPGETRNITINVAASPGDYSAWSKTVSITRSKNSVANLTSFKLNGETKTVPFAGEYTVASGTATVTDFAFDADSTGATASVSPQGNVNIPVGSGRNFTITVKAQDGTVTQNVIFTVKRKEYTVNYSVEGGQGKIQAGSYPLTTNSSLSVAYNGNVTFTAHPDPGWEVDSWKVDGSTVSSQTGTTYTLSNVTGPKTVTVKFKPGVFDLAGGPGAWKRLKEEVEKTEGAHTITISGEIKATTDSGNNGKISIRRELIIKSSGSSASLNASNLSGIFDVNNKLTLENITLKNGAEPGNRTGAGAYVNSTLIMKGSSAITDCSAHKGGGVYISNGTLIMQDSSAITNCSAAEGGGVYVSGTFKMSGSAKVDTNSDVYLASGKSIDVTGTLTNTPAARITPDSYTDGRVLATGDAEKANFTVTPKNGNENWRYKKVGNEIKFVPATLTVTFTEIKCVVEHDDGPNGEYYWTMKVDGSIVHERPKNNLWVAGDNTTLPINKSFTRSFSYFPASIPVDIEIWEHDDSFDDHVGTTKAHLTYNYDDDQWKWAYDGGNWNTNPKRNEMSNPNVIIGDGGEEIFTEQYRTSDGDTDVTIKISWKE
ncbi:hypothetical protein OE909_04845 [Treponema denticola]|uniref:InlB B-repeat-containing protein n=1 Tax=Treponema denticola TaxID=158 RepID=UPI0021F81F91|nr:hypothetical protein [Treponema denticola]UYT09071.1 hypothetical protein OE909_04845 [Treponema denticola]